MFDHLNSIILIYKQPLVSLHHQLLNIQCPQRLYLPKISVDRCTDRENEREIPSKLKRAHKNAKNMLIDSVL